MSKKSKITIGVILLSIIGAGTVLYQVNDIFFEFEVHRYSGVLKKTESVITVHGYMDNLEVCKSIVDMLNKIPGDHNSVCVKRKHKKRYL